MGRRAGVALVAVSAVSYGCLALFGRVAQENGVTTPMLLFLRFSMAALIMLGVLKVQGIGWPERRHIPKLALLGLIYTGQALCFFTALQHVTATSLVSLMLYVYPVLVTLMAWLFLKERMTAVKVGCVAVALAGSVLTIGAAGSTDTIGLIGGFGSAVFYSVYLVLGSRFLREVNVMAAALVVMAAAACAFAVIAAVDGMRLPPNAEAWFGVVGIAVIGTALAISALFAGMELIGPVNTSTISALEPAVTAALGAVFLGEVLGLQQVVGGVLILAAAIVLARSSEAA